MGTTEFISTETSQIYDGTLELSPVYYQGCGSVYGFNANPGDQLLLHFTSSTPVEFFLMGSYRDPNGFCLVGSYSMPPSLKAASYQTQYSLQWSPSDEYFNVNHSSQFYILIFNVQPASATIQLTAQVITQPTVTATLYSAYTGFLTQSEVQTLNPPIQSTTTVSANSNIAPTSIGEEGNIRWISISAFAVLLSIALFILISFRKRKKQAQDRTKIY